MVSCSRRLSHGSISQNSDSICRPTFHRHEGKTSLHFDCVSPSSKLQSHADWNNVVDDDDSPKLTMIAKRAAHRLLLYIPVVSPAGDTSPSKSRRCFSPKGQPPTIHLDGLILLTLGVYRLDIGGWKSGLPTEFGFILGDIAATRVIVLNIIQAHVLPPLPVCPAHKSLNTYRER